MTLYRYERHNLEFGDCKIQLYEYTVVKETPNGFWIHQFNSPNFKKFILKGSDGKRFAYETKEAALNNFKIRTKRCFEISKANMITAQTYLDIANKMTV